MLEVFRAGRGLRRPLLGNLLCAELLHVGNGVGEAPRAVGGEIVRHCPRKELGDLVTVGVPTLPFGRGGAVGRSQRAEVALHGLMGDGVQVGVACGLGESEKSALHAPDGSIPDSLALLVIEVVADPCGDRCHEIRRAMVG